LTGRSRLDEDRQALEAALSGVAQKQRTKPMNCAREPENIAMLNLAKAMRLRTAVFPGAIDTNKAIVGLFYVVAYVALDWVSFIEPYAQFNITPWNPNTSLSFILILVFGRRMIPFLFISPFCS
jgi:hypothetical protein